MLYTQPDKLSLPTLSIATASAGAGLLYALGLAASALQLGTVLGITGSLASAALVAGVSVAALNCISKGWQAREERIDRLAAARTADLNHTERAYVPSKFLDPREQPSGLLTSATKFGGMYMMIMGGLSIAGAAMTAGLSVIPGFISMAIGYGLHSAGGVGEQAREHAEQMTQEAAQDQRRTMTATQWAQGYGADIERRTDWAERMQKEARTISTGRA